MGRSAKTHKRTPKSTSSSGHPPQPPAKAKPVAIAPSSAPSAVQEQKRRAGMRAKAGKYKAKDTSGPVLGGADYVALMLGGRKRAREEAAKLPVDDSE